MKRRNQDPRVHRLEKQSLAPLKLYVCTALLGFIVVFLCLLFSRGELISRYLFHDTRDTGMDFFHSIEYVKGRHPYEGFSVVYPPLANLFFYVLFFLIPRGVSDQWPADFYESIAMRGTSLDLRTYQAPMLLFLLTIVVCCWMIVALTNTILHNKPAGWRNGVALGFLLSPGMLYALDRGNILMIIVPLVMFFVYFRNSSNPILRELSLISLAIATGLKLYPIFFFVLLVRDKKWGSALRFTLYCFLCFTLPMLIFREGFYGLVLWIKKVFSFGSKDEQPWTGLGFSAILHNIVHVLNLHVCPNTQFNTSWFAHAGHAVACVLLLCAMFQKKEWLRITSIVMAIITFQSQGRYVFCLISVPLVIFLSEEGSLNRRNIIPFLALTGLSINLPLFFTRGESYPNIAVLQMIILILTVYCIASTAISISHYFARSKPSKPKR